MMGSRLLGPCCLLLLVFVSTINAGCKMNISWATYFANVDGLARCGNLYYEYIRGFSRGDLGHPDKVSGIKGAACCTAPWPYTWDKFQVAYGNWFYSFDKAGWSYCPRGFFLTGLYRSKGADLLYNVEEARCMKPASAPYNYGHCYEFDFHLEFNKKETKLCKDNYFITGINRFSCNELHCLEKFKCCKLANRPDAINSLAAAKIKVMDNTLWDMAKLAHHLGYGWCAGCRAPFVGEDFNRNGDTWEADKRTPCSGYWHTNRLKLKYADWGFMIKDIKYGKAVIQELNPEAIDGGTMRNRSPFPVTHELSRTSQITRSVSHTTTSDWRQSHELGIEIAYNPPDGGVSVSTSYTFGYEQGQSTENSKGQADTASFSITQQITVPAKQSVKWSMILSKTRRTVAYTAKVLIKFSTELQGFLRYGGGYNGGSTNYHHKHRGSGGRPVVNYKFGDGSTPFYRALWDQYNYKRLPWMWDDMQAKHSGIAGTIKALASDGRYEFNLNGKFEDVMGKDVYVEWDGANGRKKRAAASKVVKEPDAPAKKVVASQQSGDPAPVFPDPPVMELDPVAEEEVSDIAVIGS